MFYVKSTTGEVVPVTNIAFTRCPKCGVEHKVDLVSLVAEHAEDHTGDILDSTMYCEECSEVHRPLWERADEIEFVASRFPGVGIGRVTEIVRNGLDQGLSFDTALAGARLALAEDVGCGSLYTLDEVESVLGCTAEQAETQMEELGIHGIAVSTLPGFSWAIDRE